MAGPRISIITPSFNQARFLEATIRSVLDQGYDNLEYIVVDGGSTDGSVEIIKRHADRLAFWCSEADVGHGNALNKGLRHATGEIIAWLNSDDVYWPWTLAAVAEIFEAHPDVNWITGFGMTLDEKGRIVGLSQRQVNIYDYLLGRYEWIQQEGTFWRRSLWEAAGSFVNESYHFMVDGELWTRFFLKAQLFHVRCALGAFRQWGGNRSTLNGQACHAEMHRCISTMRQSCGSQILENAAALNRMLRVPKFARPLANRLMKQFKPSLRWDTRYDLIYLDKARWHVRRVPWLR